MNNTSCFRMAIAASLLFAAGVAPAYAQVYKMPVTFPGYTNRAETLVNFPVLVVLSNKCDSAGQFSYGTLLSTNGYDLRFRNTNDTVDLNYEIEKWDTNGASYVWVQVASLPGDGSGAILAKWGDANSAGQLACTTNGATWSNGYVAVWHLAETNPPCHDSAGTDNSVTNLGVAGTAYTNVGKANGGWVFPGSGSAGLSGPDHPELNNLTNLTLEAWGMDTAGDATARGIVSKRKGSSDNESFCLYNQSKNINFRIGTSTAATTTAPFTTGVWHYVATTFEPVLATLEKKIYMDGLLVTSASDSQTSVPNGIGQICLGTLNVGYTSSWKGTLDELRISSAVRSTNWIWACWVNGISNNTFQS